jgi:hypothetical protein
MPLYVLCPQCTKIPVTKLNELCEDCKRKQQERDRRTEKQLDRLEKKPRRVSEVMK